MLFYTDKRETFGKVQPIFQTSENLKRVFSDSVSGGLAALSERLKLYTFSVCGKELIYLEDSVSWGYARVSSTSQRLDRQLEQLRSYGIDERHIKTEKQSGKDFERAEFLSLVGTDEVAPSMRTGDCLVVCSLDRLGRNYAEIQQWWRHITHELKCDIVVLDMPVLNTQGEGNLDKNFIADLVLQILSYVAEKERLAIRERQRQGIEAAQAKGVKFGRPAIKKPDGFDEVAAKWRSGEITATTAMRALGLSKYSFYKLVKEENKYV